MCQCSSFGSHSLKGLFLYHRSACKNRVLEQIVGVPAPQIMEHGLPIVPQEREQNRTPEQIVGVLVPQITEEHVLSRMQERVQNRPRKLFVDVPVPHIMEQTAGKVMRTEKVFTVLHHRDDQACTVDTLGFNIKGLDKYTMPRSGDVLVPALHMEVPVPLTAEELVERPLPSVHEAVTRFFEQHALGDLGSISEAPAKGLRGGGGGRRRRGGRGGR